MMVNKIHSMPDFLNGAKGQLLIDEPMSRHTSWRTGGNADYFYTPADKQDLVQVLKRLPEDLPVYWIGLGSNLLVRDSGVRGMVIRTSKGLSEIQVRSSARLYAESGVSCAKVARTSTKSNLSGVEFLAGVPGSFGGALAMNAGAFGGETWEWVEQLECIDRSGQLNILDKKDVVYGYRHVEIPHGYWILSGILKLKEAEVGFDSRGTIRSLLEKRSQSQPVQSANAGSVFRNPEGDFAARLIEQTGLKGHSIGGASISEVHANFIVNEGKASSADIENLISYACEQVRENCGVDLQLEVRILGGDQ